MLFIFHSHVLFSFFTIASCGYVLSLSPIKQLRKKKKYFDLDFVNESQQYFSCDRYLIFHELNDSFTTGCKIKYYSSPDDDSLINDRSFIAKTDLNFEKLVELKYPTSKLLLMNNNCTTRLIQKL